MKFINFVVKDYKQFTDGTWKGITIGDYTLTNGEPAIIATPNGNYPIVDIVATRQGIGRGSIKVTYDDSAVLEAPETVEEAPVEESAIDSIMEKLKAQIKEEILAEKKEEEVPEPVEEAPVVEEEVPVIEEVPKSEYISVLEPVMSAPKDTVMVIPVADGRVEIHYIRDQ